jgi:hypothetical protein
MKRLETTSEVCNVLIERDSSDPRFTVSFNIDSIDEARTFFDEFGFVVFNSVLSEEDCVCSRDAMWKIVEESCPGLSRNEPETWSLYKSAGKYGLSMRGPCFHSVLVNNRQNRNLIRALEAIVGEPVLVGHDRFTIYRATEIESCDGKSFATGPRNLHLDLNPWWWVEASKLVESGLETLQYDDEQDFIRENNMVVRSMGKNVQCVINLADNLEEDGGTIILPKFHKCIEQWSHEHLHMKKPLPWLQLSASDPLVPLGQRVPMKAVIILPTFSPTYLFSEL